MLKFDENSCIDHCLLFQVVTSLLSTMESLSPYQSTTYHCERTERVKRDGRQTNRSTSIIKSLRLGQAFYSIALVWVEILFLVAWIAPMTSTSNQVSPRLRAEHTLTLLAGLLSNVYLIIWHISYGFRTWRKLLLVDAISSVTWSSLTIWAACSRFRIDQDESPGPLSDTACRRAYVALIFVLAAGSANFIAGSLVDLCLSGAGTGAKQGRAEKVETGSP
ncbi:hypothetical protein F5Y16DRAFT_393036 [Xylariaceae sp. FL0255]|nr:hypothetical protein F5Y16DRAFT_393036 [Xylariaceae sp. FL0255]